MGNSVDSGTISTRDEDFLEVLIGADAGGVVGGSGLGGCRCMGRYVVVAKRMQDEGGGG
jgi:hypothetical protein